VAGLSDNSRVVSEVLAHLGIIIRRSKGKNYGSAGATILPQCENVITFFLTF
jgi:hypothetical protein